MLELLLLSLTLLRPAASLLANQNTPDSSDLFSYVTRPDIRAPRFNISTYHPEQISPGYWFTAPYVDLKPRLKTSLFSPGQTGPLIYDSRGELVWSGSHLFGDRPTFDFKVAEHNGTEFLTFMVGEDLNDNNQVYPGGSGVIFDNQYQFIRNVDDKVGKGIVNMHEFNTIENGTKALTITFDPKFVEVRRTGSFPNANGVSTKMFVGNNGFAEVDTNGQPVFEWWALDWLDPDESMVNIPNGAGGSNSAWDFLHLNSVDKDANGDYLISGRFTNTIYKISGKDGSILWRLGGKLSNFELDGFNFSSQHDARFQSENETTTVLTFFNNHSDGITHTSFTSYAMEVAVDHISKVATVVQSWPRPDGRLTQLRGNAQRLPNNNMFVGWSENTYISEFNAAGLLLMEAQFASYRLNTYRAYKFNFTANPKKEEIAAKAFVYGITPDSATTVHYVSWNGATEVRSWRFYAADEQTKKLVPIGEARRTGFETTFMSSGVAHRVMVQALGAKGEVLGNSEIVAAELPPSWEVLNQISDSLSKAFGDDKKEASATPNSHINSQHPATKHSKSKHTVLSAALPETGATAPAEDEDRATESDEVSNISTIWDVKDIPLTLSSLPFVVVGMIIGTFLTMVVFGIAQKLRQRRQRLGWMKYHLVPDEC